MSSLLPSSPPPAVVDLTKNSHSSVSPQTPLRPQTRKITIKNLKSTPDSIPTAYFQQTATKLQQAVSIILHQGNLSDSLEELYRGVENLVRENKGGDLYQMLETNCRAFVSDTMKQSIEEGIAGSVGVGGDGGIRAVDCIESAWGKWTSQLGLIRSIFYYLDRAHILINPKLSSIMDMGYGFFRESILSNNETLQPFIDGLLTIIKKDRYHLHTSNPSDGEPVAAHLVLSSLSILSTLDLYYPSFAQALVQSTQSYYHAESERLSTTLKPAEYIAHVKDRLQQESQRCSRFFERQSNKEVMQVTHTELISPIADDIIDRGFSDLVKENDVESLKVMYSLLNLVNDLNVLRTTWAKYIKDTGVELVLHPERDEEMVLGLLTFKSSLDNLLHKSFNSNLLFSQSLRESFEWFINRRRDKPAEYIAKYLDTLLRKGDKGITIPDINGNHTLEEEMDRVLVMFRFVHGKDIFEAFYKKDLAKRLLLGKSASADAERSMLSKLKNECGAQFTQKLEGMFKDIDVSQDFMKSFKEQRHASQIERSLHVNVLSQSWWPTYTEKQVILPETMVKGLQAFKDFYLKKQSGRKLMWRHSLGHCILTADFPKGKKELNVSLFQGVVLLLFNSNDDLSYSFIQKATNLEPQELERTLQSLACGKSRVLIKSSKGKEIHNHDIFSFNKEFTSSLYRLKINQIQLRETPQEQNDTHDAVKRDRQFEVQATIVRIMKSRKKIRHTELVAQIIEQTKDRGTLDMADIKKNIDKLLEKDYMEREEGSRDVYNYVA